MPFRVTADRLMAGKSSPTTEHVPHCSADENQGAVLNLLTRLFHHSVTLMPDFPDMLFSALPSYHSFLGSLCEQVGSQLGTDLKETDLVWPHSVMNFLDSNLPGSHISALRKTSE